MVIMTWSVVVCWWLIITPCSMLSEIGLSGKRTRQSSTYKEEDVYSSGRAVDGNTNGFVISGRFCTHTLRQQNPWWYVDLVTPTCIDHVVLFNRLASDCCEDRLSGAIVRIGNDEDVVNNTACPQEPVTDAQISANQSISIACNNLSGQYISVHLVGREQTLTLCEVKAVQGVCSGNNIVIGAAVGCVLFVGLVVLAVLLFIKSRQSDPSDIHEDIDLDVYEIPNTLSDQTADNQNVSNPAVMTDNEAYTGLDSSTRQPESVYQGVKNQDPDRLETVDNYQSLDETSRLSAADYQGIYHDVKIEVHNDEDVRIDNSNGMYVNVKEATKAQNKQK